MQLVPWTEVFLERAGVDELCLLEHEDENNIGHSVAGSTTMKIGVAG